MYFLLHDYTRLAVMSKASVGLPSHPSWSCCHTWPRGRWSNYGEQSHRTGEGEPSAAGLLQWTLRTDSSLHQSLPSAEAGWSLNQVFAHSSSFPALGEDPQGRILLCPLAHHWKTCRYVCLLKAISEREKSCNLGRSWKVNHSSLHATQQHWNLYFFSKSGFLRQKYLNTKWLRSSY